MQSCLEVWWVGRTKTQPGGGSVALRLPQENADLRKVIWRVMGEVKIWFEKISLIHVLYLETTLGVFFFFLNTQQKG